LLLTSFCFAKGSTKFHQWFIHTKLYQKHLDSFITNRSMLLLPRMCFAFYIYYIVLCSENSSIFPKKF
ncbi:MAG: DUF454 family protein, partial [Niameybacter sp.]|nr:DUF454 family protein [Niameybacter sp.]